MNTAELKERYVGQRFTVVHCLGAIESYQVALSRVLSGKSRSLTPAMVAQIKRLADGHRMSRENFPKEGELPRRKGQQSPKFFYAFKKIPIRAYCWLSDSHKNTYFISHYIYKDFDSLDPSDTGRVGNNWRRIEENGDER